MRQMRSWIKLQHRLIPRYARHQPWSAFIAFHLVACMLVSMTSCQSGNSSAGVRLPRSEAPDSIQANVKVLAQAEAKSEEAARKKRPADSEAAFSSKAQKTDDVQRKREPIAFKPCGSAGAENGQREGSADLRRSGSQKEKGSVFERLHSSAGKACFSQHKSC